MCEIGGNHSVSTHGFGERSLHTGALNEDPTEDVGANNHIGNVRCYTGVRFVKERNKSDERKLLLTARHPEDFRDQFTARPKWRGAIQDRIHSCFDF